MPQGILYPQGCRPVSEELGADELIRRLKTLAHTLQAMGQDEGMYHQYVPLALHLAEDFFLQHPSKDVQLLIACCIADVLRVYAPEAPYKDPEQVKTIFFFIIKQLSGLRDPKDPAFKRYFYLLENLAYVKSFNMCFELEDNQEIFCNLFTLMFDVVNDEHSTKVKSFMLDIMCPLIVESDMVSHELLDIILSNIVDPNKTQRKNAYNLAKDLIIKCSDTLEPYIQNFFNHELLLGKEETKLSISAKLYDLLYELNKICPSVLLAVLPQLDCKLKSSLESERLQVVSVLAKMFSEKNSDVALKHNQLWRSFLGRFNDISVAIRIKCIQYSMHFLLNHPHLREDITEALKARQHDTDESVRYELVLAIVSAAKRDIEVICQHDELLELVKERTLDKKFKIRKQSLCGLANIYLNVWEQKDSPPALKKKISWIKDKVLHGYYMSGAEDRCLVERLLNTCLVPYTLPVEQKMKRLYHLMGTMDEHASKAFIELQKHQAMVRTKVKEWLVLHRRPKSPENTKEISARVVVLAKYLPEPLKVQEYLHNFSDQLSKDESLLLGMEALTRYDISCKDYADTTNLIIKRLGQPVMTNVYYNVVKMLLERMSCVMIDSTNLKVLIPYVEECINNGPLIKELCLDSKNAGEKGLKLLEILSYIFPNYFLRPEIIKKLLSFLNMEKKVVVPYILAIFTSLGKTKPLMTDFPDETNNLLALCKNFVLTGTTKEVKQAIRCIYMNVFKHDENVFNDIFENIKENLVATSPRYLHSIVALGHIAVNVPLKYTAHIKNLISRKIVRELLVKKDEQPSNSQNRNSAALNGNWCSKENLPLNTLCMYEAIKMMARWLWGLKNDEISAQKSFRMFSAYVSKGGNISPSKELSEPEMAWLRYGAGCAMLKVSQQKGVGDQYTVDQFYVVSKLMHDSVPMVRQLFVNKLHKGLIRHFPHRNLPLDFMSYYVFGGVEEDKTIKQTIKQAMLVDITRRRDYIKNLTRYDANAANDVNSNDLVSILPDYMLVPAIALLAHSSIFTNSRDIGQLTKMKNCLWFILEPLIMKNETYNYGFYKNMLDQIKYHKDVLQPDDEHVNERIWTLSDLTMKILISKSVNFEMKDMFADIKISSFYFKKVEDPLFVNDKCYVIDEFRIQSDKLSKNANNLNAKKAKADRPVPQDSINYNEDRENKVNDNESGIEPKRRKITRNAK